MMKAEVFGSKYKSFVILDPMTVPMESIYNQLQNTRVFTTAMLAAPMAKSQKSQRVVEASRKSQNLNCFGVISKPVSTSMIVAEKSLFLIERAGVGRIKAMRKAKGWPN